MPMNVIEYLSQKSFGHSLLAFVIFILLLKIVTKFIENSFGKKLRQSKLSPDNVVCLEIIISGSAILIPTLLIYFISQKLIFVWLLCSIAIIIGGGLGLIPFSFVKKRRK
jgi:hypothetical protein